jgi:hypothetical protein
MPQGALHKKSGQKSDSAVTKDFLVSFWRFFEIKKSRFEHKKHRQGTLFVQSPLDRSQWGLIEVAQLVNYKGTIWATWDATAPPFLDYLGEMRLYL